MVQTSRTLLKKCLQENVTRHSKTKIQENFDKATVSSLCQNLLCGCPSQTLIKKKEFAFFSILFIYLFLFLFLFFIFFFLQSNVPFQIRADRIIDSNKDKIMSLYSILQEWWEGDHTSDLNNENMTSSSQSNICK